MEKGKTYRVSGEGLTVSYVGSDGYQELRIDTQLECISTKHKGRFKIVGTTHEVIPVGSKSHTLQRLTEISIR